MAPRKADSMSVITSNYGYAQRFADDVLNLKKKRRQNNTDYYAYNCGGFALGTYSWYFPIGDDILDWAVDHEIITADERDTILENVTEDDYYWDEVDFCESYNNNVPKNATHTIPTYDKWRLLQYEEELNNLVGDIFDANSPFFDYFIEYMLKEFKDLRLVDHVTDVKENEYCIAFRIGHGDFHFARANSNNTIWIQKLGWMRIRNENWCWTTRYTEEAFDKMFGRRYDSATALFAKQK